MNPPPQLPPRQPTQITIFQISGAIRIWAQLFVRSRGHCVCGRYTFHGLCGHVVHQETLLCGNTRTPSGTTKCCHLLTPVYYTDG
ncbi:hypothetical protein A9K55_008711 [Cordyceps militaris]|uniref:Uncharacterized protein n=1 Tax=Cordyceps militaris TaxID=73501 RepID=A0A2H4SEF8_CORMI|nr:hypothetical protein A9K55_008711 [Cordyceps militaris]